MYNPPVSLPHLLAPLVEAHYVDLTSIELVDAEDLVGLRHLSMLVIIVCVCARACRRSRRRRRPCNCKPSIQAMPTSAARRCDWTRRRHPGLVRPRHSSFLCSPSALPPAPDARGAWHHACRSAVYLQEHAAQRAPHRLSHRRSRPEEAARWRVLRERVLLHKLTSSG